MEKIYSNLETLPLSTLFQNTTINLAWILCVQTPFIDIVLSVIDRNEPCETLKVENLAIDFMQCGKCFINNKFVKSFLEKIINEEKYTSLDNFIKTINQMFQLGWSTEQLLPLLNKTTKIFETLLSRKSLIYRKEKASLASLMVTNKEIWNNLWKLFFDEKTSIRIEALAAEAYPLEDVY